MSEALFLILLSPLIITCFAITAKQMSPKKNELEETIKNYRKDMK